MHCDLWPHKIASSKGHSGPFRFNSQIHQLQSSLSKPDVRPLQVGEMSRILNSYSFQRFDFFFSFHGDQIHSNTEPPGDFHMSEVLLWTWSISHSSGCPPLVGWRADNHFTDNWVFAKREPQPVPTDNSFSRLDGRLLRTVTHRAPPASPWRSRQTCTLLCHFHTASIGSWISYLKRHSPEDQSGRLPRLRDGERSAFASETPDSLVPPRRKRPD